MTWLCAIAIGLAVLLLVVAFILAMGVLAFLLAHADADEREV